MTEVPGIDPSVPPSGTGCVECDAAGGWWLHLRRCAQCGHIGCCDTSPSQHATAHAKATGHPFIRSFEPGETGSGATRPRRPTRARSWPRRSTTPTTSRSRARPAGFPSDWQRHLPLAAPGPDRELLRVLRRPGRRRAGDGGRRPDRRAHRRLPGRAHHADPVEGQAEGPGRRVRADLPDPVRAGHRHLPGPRDHDRHERGRAQPGRAGRASCARSRPRLGLAPKIAHIEGDDLLDRIGELTDAGHALAHADTGEPLAKAGVTPVTANAYLGGWGIAAALRDGADVVVCPRVTDASLVVGSGRGLARLGPGRPRRAGGRGGRPGT